MHYHTSITTPLSLCGPNGVLDPFADNMLHLLLRLCHLSFESKTQIKMPPRFHPGEVWELDGHFFCGNSGAHRAYMHEYHSGPILPGSSAVTSAELDHDRLSLDSNPHDATASANPFNQEDGYLGTVQVLENLQDLVWNLSNKDYEVFPFLKDAVFKSGLHKAEGLPPAEYECAICKTTVEDNELTLEHTTCTVQAHAECILPWLRRHGTCPLCQRSMKNVPNDNDDNTTGNIDPTEAAPNTQHVGHELLADIRVGSTDAEEQVRQARIEVEAAETLLRSARERLRQAEERVREARQ